MRHTPRFLMTDPEEVMRLIRANPWATFVSAPGTGLVASHYPVATDPEDLDLHHHATRLTRRVSPPHRICEEPVSRLFTIEGVAAV